MDIIKIILGLLGGLALFLYGMQMMASGLEAAAGDRMRKILEKLTSNRILGVIVGIVITAVVQSSSATTVMVVGFVNSGLMQLRQAVWVIMGANIGTTITGQLIALDMGRIAPLFAFVGVALIVFIKKVTIHHYGQIVAGLGILFIGMKMMSEAMVPLRESQTFIDLMIKFENPLLAILVGALFTALIQSSAASIGILQTLAINGLISFPSAVYILFGQNIGTCITALLASIGTNRRAKQTTIIHFLFNFIGTAIFTAVCYFTPLTSLVEAITPNNQAAQIANMHTLFNISTTLLLLPFGALLANIAEKILPAKSVEMSEKHQLMYIKPISTSAEYQVGNTSIAINGIKRELERMIEMAKVNVSDSFAAIIEGNTARIEKVRETEEYIDYLNREISKYVSRVISFENNPHDAKTINKYFQISGNIERIGDHALNICEYSSMLAEKKIKFSEDALDEIAQMQSTAVEAMELLEPSEKDRTAFIVDIAAIEQKIDDMTREFRENQLERMSSSACQSEAGIIYSELLTDFERIGDHVLNVGQDLSKTQ